MVSFNGIIGIRLSEDVPFACPAESAKSFHSTGTVPWECARRLLESDDE